MCRSETPKRARCADSTMQEEKNCNDYTNPKGMSSASRIALEKNYAKNSSQTRKLLAVSDEVFVSLASQRTAERTPPQSVIQAALPVLQTASRLAASPNATRAPEVTGEKCRKPAFELAFANQLLGCASGSVPTCREQWTCGS